MAGTAGPRIKCAEITRRRTSRKRAVGPPAAQSRTRSLPQRPPIVRIGFAQAPRSSALIIATWNVNSVRQRIGHLLDYLKEASPDALCLQEIKCVDDAFPRLEVEALGYNIALHGQKGFNGVAILSKRPFEVATGLPGDPDDVQARYIEGVIPTKRGVVRVASIYLPNGNPTRNGEIYIQARLHGPTHPTRAETAHIRGAVGVGRRLQRHSRSARRRPSRAMDAPMLCSCRRRAPSSTNCSRSASPRRCARRPMPAGSTVSGTIRRVLGNATTESASTTCYCPRRRPIS